MSLFDNSFILSDRILKIQSVIKYHGEDKFFLSFSGGKDSTVLHYLLDQALPGNQIPRVFIDTGIEYGMIRSFVKNLARADARFVILTPKVNIRKMLDENGYPFKSKEHSLYVDVASRGGINCKTAQRYLNPGEDRKRYGCPEILRYQFENPPFKISNKCCYKLKKERIAEWQNQNHRPLAITGLMAAEGGMRSKATCLAYQHGKLKAFQPLAVVTKAWEEWYIKIYGVKICDIYKPPYNFKRTGCKGCPYNPELQKALDVMQQHFPNERKQCEIIWKPVYEEYRRLGYRLRKEQ